jgi:hypothetical protein
MADMRYFSEHNGEAVQLRQITCMDNATFKAQFPDVVGKRYDSFSRMVGKAEDGTVLPVLRLIEYKGNPSKHKCDSRCLNAQGKTMKCECACGGKNHGRGSFVCEAA